MRIVRDLTKLFGCNVVYARENGYFKKDEFDGPEWQFGADYLECQKMYARLERGEQLTKEEQFKLIKDHCGLMHRAAYMRSMYGSAMDVIDGKAEFREG